MRTLIAAGLLGLVACQPSAAATPTTVTVVIGTDSSFGDDLTIVAGSTVVFVNNDDLDHTAVNGTDGRAAPGSLFSFSLANGGGTASYTFDHPGTYPVTCILHRRMHLTITVRPATSGNPLSRGASGPHPRSIHSAPTRLPAQ